MGKKSVVAVGGTYISTAAYKFGDSSGFFDGTDDYLACDDSADFAFGTDAFCIDAWVRFPAFSSSARYTICGCSEGNNYITFEVLDNGRLSLSSANGGVTIVSMATSRLTWANGQWYHVAVTKSGSAIRLFRDGAVLSIDTGYWYTGYSGGSFPDVNAAYKVGTLSGASRFFHGYIDELRISKGAARWTAAFTPPAIRHETDEYTKLLLHFEGVNGSTIFIDSSAPAYKANGSAVYGPIALPAVEAFRASAIDWVQTVPAGTTVTVEASASGSWMQCTKGGAIPGLIPGSDLYLRVTMSTTDDAFTPTLSRLAFWYEGADDHGVIRVFLTDIGRLKHPQGNVAIAYTASQGNLKNVAGTLDVPTFAMAFDPDENKLALFFNPHDAENIGVAAAVTIDINKVTFVSGQAQENIGVTPALLVAVYDTNNNPV